MRKIYLFIKYTVTTIHNNIEKQTHTTHGCLVINAWSSGPIPRYTQLLHSEDKARNTRQRTKLPVQGMEGGGHALTKLNYTLILPSLISFYTYTVRA